MLQLLNKVSHNPLELMVGLCVLVVAAAGGAVLNVASTALAMLFIASLFYIREWGAFWHSLDRIEKYLCIGFILYVASGLLSYVNVEDSIEFVKQFGRYLRVALIIPVYLVIRAKNLDVSRYLFVGVVLSGFVYFGFALHDFKQGVPASGQYHHITFGNAIMLNVGIMSLLLFGSERKWLWIYRVMIGVSLLCGLCAALLSGSRGAWAALPIYLIIILVYILYTASNKKHAVMRLLLFVTVINAFVYISPIKEVINKRYENAVSDMALLKKSDNYGSSLGIRFALWSISYDVWLEHPIVGTGLGDFDNDVQRYQEMGKYPGVIVNASTHNIYMQALVGTGLIGLIALCYALFVAPLVVFKRAVNVRSPLSVIGAILISSYAIFGVSESWILRAPVVSIYLIYMISVLSVLMNASGKASSEVK